MEEFKNNDLAEQSESIEEMLRKKDELDQLIRKKFKKEVTILFTDICGYTKYMEKMGDIKGRTMLQKHNDIVMPAIKEHNGFVIKTIGDAVMATFNDPLKAVTAAISIQKKLYDHNQQAKQTDNIHVKIGVNTGEVIVDKTDVFGDAVNVAARIQGKADKDIILISKDLYERICGSEDMLCRHYDTVELKGKEEPMELYRVVWKDESLFLQDHKVRAREELVDKQKGKALPLLNLELTRVDDILKISAYEQIPGEASTVRHYEEMPVPIDKINSRCREIVEILNKANRLGRVSRETLMKLRSIGQVFTDDLFTHNVKDRLKGTKAEHLIVHLDDQLVQIPWELLHDGSHFLCQRFSMGRLIQTRQNAYGEGQTRSLGKPLKMLVLSDPGGDLKGAYREGKQIIDFVDMEKEFINASLRSEGITPDFIKEKIRNFDIVHFAGHSDYDINDPGKSGWRLSRGRLTASNIIKLAGTASMPALIFSNACQSARTEEWAIADGFHEEIFGLANAFVLAGVKHYVGTFWEILDEPSSRFALEFYKYLLAGMTIGQAIREARIALIKKYGEETIVWGSYLLYGDPTFSYMEQIRLLEKTQEPQPISLETTDTETRATEEVIDFGKEEKRKKAPLKWIAAAVLAVIAGILLWGYPGYLKEGTVKYESQALTYYQNGNFDKAFDVCKTLEDKNSDLRLPHVIRGNIAFRKGDLDSSKAFYDKALNAKKGTNKEKADALIGLGRIASLKKQTDRALEYYRKASELAPDNSTGYMSQALVLERNGKYEKALNLLDRAGKIDPDNSSIAALAGETRKKIAFAKDSKKRERINRLVKELLSKINTRPVTTPWDGWTSRPVTLWINDFTIQGYSLQEGEERLLVSEISSQLIENSHAQLVERNLLDTLLGELKFGTSKLIDQRTALSLGKILAARLIMTGRIVYSGPETHVSLRLLETETGRITAAVSESFGNAVPASVIADNLSKKVLEKLKKLYPLRGKITNVKDDKIELNIGSSAGVAMGQKFKVSNSDIVLKTVSVQLDKSLAAITKGNKHVLKGYRIEAF